MDCRETSEILALFVLKTWKQIFTFKIIFISIFFGLDIPFILSELESKEKLRKYFNISKVWSANQVYKTLSLRDPKNLLNH